MQKLGNTCKIAITALAFALAFASAPASAHPRHHHHRHHVRLHHHHHRAVLIGGEVEDAGGRSGSCLRFRVTAHLWCGCASADRVGLDNSSGFWNLAAHWFTLPRAARAAGMAAVRYGHVLILERPISGTVWWAYDPNSGGGRARFHAVETRHLTIVNPHGGRFRTATAQ